jgi:hypothetical protein
MTPGVTAIVVKSVTVHESYKRRRDETMAISADSPENRAYYVRRDGSDAHDGVSGETAYKTLAKAVESAKNGAVKRIVVTGPLDEESKSRTPRHLPRDPGGKSVLSREASGTADIEMPGVKLRITGPRSGAVSCLFHPSL